MASSSERYFRVYRIDRQGHESVLDPCLRSRAAESFIRSYNQVAQDGRAVAREIDVLSARLLGNPHG